MIAFEVYKGEEQLEDLMRLISKDLSEPYSIYTFRYFIHSWPQLCHIAVDRENGKIVGAIVGKLGSNKSQTRRGYLAMLAVDSNYRGQGIGSALSNKLLNCMIAEGVVEIVLETEVTNAKALALYGKLGFVRERRLPRYYLNGSDAFRLKLWTQ